MTTGAAGGATTREATAASSTGEAPVGRVASVVALLSRTARYGGPAEVALAQARLLRARGVEVTVVGGTLAGDEPDPEPGVEALAVHRWLPVKDFIGLLSWRAIRGIDRAVRDADVVHVAFAREAVPAVGAMLALARRRRLVVQPHGMLTARVSRLHRLLDHGVRPVVRRADRIVTLTEVEAEDLREWFGGGRMPPIEAVGNPEPPTDASRDADDGTGGIARPGRATALFAARLHPRKRPGDFVDAAAVAHARGHAIDYVVAGPDQGELARVRQAEAGPGAVRYVGSLDEPALARAVAQADVFVLPSHREPWGQVLVAAMLSGTPVALAASSALAGEVERLGAGRVFADEDPEALEAAVWACVEDARAGRFEPDVAGIHARFSDKGVTDALLRAYGWGEPG